MNFKKGLGNNTISYPLTQDQIDNFDPCDLVNPKVGNSYGYKVPDNFSLQKAYKEVVHVRMDVLNNKYPHWFMEKYYPFEGFEYKERMPVALKREGLSIGNPRRCSRVVWMDLPSQMPNAVLRWLLSKGYNVNAWTDKHINFLESVPDMQELITDGVKKSLDRAFEMKYYFGVARPEEVYAANGFGGNMTAYPEGCPTHPSIPAGHSSAAAGGVKALLDNFEPLSQEDLQEALDSAYLWAMWRTFAGVHYAEDNVLGLIANGLGDYIRQDVKDPFTL